MEVTIVRPAPVVAFAAAFLLGGCALVSPGDSVPPASVSGRFDGSYQGGSRLVSALAPGCPAGHEGVVEIGDGILTYAYTPAVMFSTHVLPDGRLEGNAGPVVLLGRIAGNHLAMTITSPQCRTDYSADYVWNHS
jgi:hypothetical protein